MRADIHNYSPGRRDRQDAVLGASLLPTPPVNDPRTCRLLPRFFRLWGQEGGGQPDIHVAVGLYRDAFAFTDKTI
jgi:hypothetical protein